MTPPSRVVVIEDDDDQRTALGRVLRAGGFGVDSYASAEAFLDAPPSDPVCLLLDIQLTGASGLELLRELRATGSALPVIVITASDGSGTREEAEQLGCMAYLRKPCEGRELVKLIRTLE